MRYCRWRGNVNRSGVASSRRSLFLMIVAIAAACSALDERAAFATAPGRFARTLLQYIVFILGLCIEPGRGSMTFWWCWMSFFGFP